MADASELAELLQRVIASSPDPAGVLAMVSRGILPTDEDGEPVVASQPDDGAADRAITAQPGVPLGERLKSLLVAYQEPHEFKVGDLVRWKTGLQNKRLPGVGEPAIVVMLIDPPLSSTSEGTASPYFREPLDIQLGVLDKDGDLIFAHFDKARFEPFTG